MSISATDREGKQLYCHNGQKSKSNGDDDEGASITDVDVLTEFNASPLLNSFSIQPITNVFAAVHSLTDLTLHKVKGSLKTIYANKSQESCGGT